jgi:flagellar hook protein FlgE
MFAGVSGLRNHQIRMDVIGNNIANVNTVGYKASRVTFQEVFSQMIRGAGSPTDEQGGTNPQMVGLGMSVAGIDVLHTQGNLQTGGKMTDLAVQGSGFFALERGGQLLYTRAGAFDIDGQGYLVNPADGSRVLGWSADAGVMPLRDRSNLGPIVISPGQTVPAKATDAIAFARNLDASLEVGAKHVTSIDVYDSLGARHNMVMTFTKSGANAWSWDAAIGATALGNGTLTFADSGELTASTGGPIAYTPAGAQAMSITPSFDSLSQYNAASSATPTGRNGYVMGSLESFSIDNTGTITGVFSNGETMVLAQVALVNFSNPAGLVSKGGGMFADSNNSGVPQLGAPGTGGRGTIAPNSLEMSNVDLSQEFTNMIVTQRGFQANSRIITTSDEMLQELVNLKR